MRMRRLARGWRIRDRWPASALWFRTELLKRLLWGRLRAYGPSILALERPLPGINLTAS